MNIWYFHNQLCAIYQRDDTCTNFETGLILSSGKRQPANQNFGVSNSTKANLHYKTNSTKDTF